MDNDYGCAGQALSSNPQTLRKETALDQLRDNAAAAESIGDMIEGFLCRCKGSGADVPEEGTLREVPSGHFAQMERLAKLLARAEDLARELGNVG